MRTEKRWVTYALEVTVAVDIEKGSDPESDDNMEKVGEATQSVINTILELAQTGYVYVGEYALIDSGVSPHFNEDVPATLDPLEEFEKGVAEGMVSVGPFWGEAGGVIKN
jgi:hypothetical protein